MKKRIFIAGGGTGGHIYPALAIAKALEQQDSNVEITFIGSKEGLESKIIPREGYRLVLIRSGKLNYSGGLLKKIQAGVNAFIGLFEALWLMIGHRPDFVIGVGGYASGPAVLAASLIGLRTAIWEANTHPGLANRWLSRFVDSCYVVFDEASDFLRCESIKQFGMPLRQQIENAQEAFERTSKESSSPLKVLIFGGSQGARSINQAFFSAVEADPSWLKGLKVVHQIGALDYKKFSEKYAKLNTSVEVLEFIYDMPKYLQWADVAICRGGAGTIAEVSAFGLPSIVIPLPLADSHQEQNARVLVKEGAAEMILQKELTPDLLKAELLKLAADASRRQSMSQNVKKLFKGKGANLIANDILMQVGD